MTFTVDADVAGPIISSGTPTTDSASSLPTEKSVFITFNEVIQNNGNLNKAAIKNWDFMGTNAVPGLISDGTVQNGQRQTITLKFDTAVQAGTGSLYTYKFSNSGPESVAITGTSVAFAGANVIFKP